MKKLLSVVLLLCLLTVAGVSLTSCTHKCEFSAEWSKDAVAHWHACTDPDCIEIADKADHTWDEGQITTEATQEAEGVKTFTCSVCAQTKTEPVAFTGMTQAAWNAMLDQALFENFSYREVASTTGSGVTVNSETIYRFTKDMAWVKMTVAEQTEEGYAPDAAAAAEARTSLLQSIKAMIPYDSYDYDPATKTYKATAPIRVEAVNASTSDIVLTVSDGKLAEFQYTISFVQNNISFTSTSTVTLSDYGTVVLTPPTA